MKMGPWTENILDNDKHYITLFVIVDQFEGQSQLLEAHKFEGRNPGFKPIQSFIANVSVEALN
jgi:8-oxo-dGTP diphosphatase